MLRHTCRESHSHNEVAQVAFFWRRNMHTLVHHNERCPRHLLTNFLFMRHGQIVVCTIKRVTPQSEAANPWPVHGLQTLARQSPAQRTRAEAGPACVHEFAVHASADRSQQREVVKTLRSPAALLRIGPY